MVSDSIINASILNVSKDFGKKGRENRAAKLKQCELDALREQWLSQAYMYLIRDLLMVHLLRMRD